MKLVTMQKQSAWVSAVVVVGGRRRRREAKVPRREEGREIYGSTAGEHKSVKQEILGTERRTRSVFWELVGAVDSW